MSDSTSDVQQLYVAYFGRPADAGGLKFWTDALNNGAASYSSISHQFWTSPEFQQTYAGQSNRQIINAIYHNLFSREGDSGGLDFWTAEFTEKQVPLEEIIARITKEAQAPDAAVLGGKVMVGNAFSTHMDLASEQAAYLTPAGMQVGHDFMASVQTTGQAAFDLNSPGLIDSVIAQFAHASSGEAPQTVQMVGVHDAGVIG